MIKKLCVFCLISLLSCKVDKSEWQNYETHRFYISYPDNLNFNEHIEGAEFMLSTEKSSEDDIFVENINLISYDVNITFDEFVKYSYQEINKIAKIVDNSIFDNNGVKVSRMIFEIIEDDIPLTILQHSLVSNSRAYTLTFTAESSKFYSYLDQMEDVILTFKLNQH